MTRQVLIAGGGMGGLAACIAAARAGWQPSLFEKAQSFAESGAGIQLGPNATRILQAWELGPALVQAAAFPHRLVVRGAANGVQLAAMPLGDSFLQRYGAPYATVHRADLHALLLKAARGAGAQLNLSAPVTEVRETPHAVLLRADGADETEGGALVGADGLWSTVRSRLWQDAPPQPTGHLAYRALLRQQDLPAGLRSDDVTVWLGPRLHVVAYPVRQGQWLNLVAIVEGATAGDAREWDQAGVNADLQQALGATCAALRDLVGAVAAWRLWVLHERAPLQGAGGMARGRVALLGDAAHPMRPYLAQGAAMAIEDAQALGQCLALASERITDVPAALQRYALQRWKRNARVQRRAARNGHIFHATGAVRWGRDAGLRLLGERLLDVPWLYR
ncbi:MAG: FAD-dependent monooxygenase [Ramlibacter sp.]